jgi:hypothetical protein
MNLNMYVYCFIHHISTTIVWTFAINHGTILVTFKITPRIDPYMLHKTTIEVQVIFNFSKLINKLDLIEVIGFQI